LPITRAGGFYTMASGGLGYALPAAVGVALATSKRVICVIGDGSSMYSIQAIWTAVQLNLPLTVIVLNNSGYGAMRSFSKIMQSQAIPGLDLPNIDFVQLAESMGCHATRVSQHEQLTVAMNNALETAGSYLLEVIIDSGSGAVY